MSENISEKAEERTRTATWWAISLKYGTGAVALFLAVRTLGSAANHVFALLVGNAVTLGQNGLVDVVTESIWALLFALVAFLLYKKASKEILAAPDYVNQPLYHLITNALVAALAFEVIYDVAVIVSVLLNSLFLIGAGADYGMLYLGQFVPALISTGVAAVAAMFAFNIMKGKNRSLPMTLTVLAVAGAMFVMAAIIVPVKAHSSSSSASNVPTTTSASDYFNSLKN